MRLCKEEAVESERAKRSLERYISGSISVPRSPLALPRVFYKSLLSPRTVSARVALIKKSAPDGHYLMHLLPSARVVEELRATALRDGERARRAEDDLRNASEQLSAASGLQQELKAAQAVAATHEQVLQPLQYRVFASATQCKGQTGPKLGSAPSRLIPQASRKLAREKLELHDQVRELERARDLVCFLLSAYYRLF